MSSKSMNGLQYSNQGGQYNFKELWLTAIQIIKRNINDLSDFS